MAGPIHVKGFVAKNDLAVLKIDQQGRRSRGVVVLAGCDGKATRQALGIRHGMSFRRQSASPSAHTTI